MADLCKACSVELLGRDERDLAGLVTKEDWRRGFAADAICEGCGFIQVDPDGNCVTPGCIMKGKPGHGLPWLKGESADESRAQTVTEPGDRFCVIALPKECPECKSSKTNLQMEANAQRRRYYECRACGCKWYPTPQPSVEAEPIIVEGREDER